MLQKLLSQFFRRVTSFLIAVIIQKKLSKFTLKKAFYFYYEMKGKIIISLLFFRRPFFRGPLLAAVGRVLQVGESTLFGRE